MYVFRFVSFVRYEWIVMPHLATPTYSLSSEEKKHVYEPAEDSFLLLDALELEFERIKVLRNYYRFYNVRFYSIFTQSNEAQEKQMKRNFLRRTFKPMFCFCIHLQYDPILEFFVKKSYCNCCLTLYFEETSKLQFYIVLRLF